MKLNLCLNKLFFKILCIVILIMIFGLKTKASVDEDLKNITSKLRCMTCQNQTIYDSDAEFSLYIKKIVKERLENNYSDKEIVDFLVYRYGEYILFEPKMNKQNFFLWFFPFIILAVSLVFLIFRIKKKS